MFSDLQGGENSGQEIRYPRENKHRCGKTSRKIKKNMFPAIPLFVQTQTKHPNNIIYLSPEDP